MLLEQSGLPEIGLKPGTRIVDSIARIQEAARSGRIDSVERSIQKAVAEAVCASEGTNEMHVVVAFNSDRNAFMAVIATSTVSMIAKEFKTKRALCELS